MPPLNKQNPPETTQIPVSDATAASDATYTDIVKDPQPKPYATILGLGLLAVSVLGGIGLLFAYLPLGGTKPHETQAAAVSTSVPQDYFADLQIAAKSAYVYDTATDKPLYAKSESAQLPLASITKVMLVLAVSEVLPMDGTVTISRGAVERGEGGLTFGELWRVKDLIDYTLITSSNTGAEALAEAANALLAKKYPQGSQKNATLWRMNALAAQIGMNETYFINASGLDESPTQAGAQGSSRDVAKMFGYAIRTNPSLFAATTEDGVTLAPLNFPEREAHNTNEALPNLKGLIMGKTGTTDLAGGNLAVAFNPNTALNHPLIVVVLGSTPEGRFSDTLTLAEKAVQTISPQ